MHMLILNFLHQMQCNPPPADTTAKLLLRKKEQEMFLHSNMAKGDFPIQLSGLCLKALCSLKGYVATLRSKFPPH